MSRHKWFNESLSSLEFNYEERGLGPARGCLAGLAITLIFFLLLLALVFGLALLLFS